MSFDVFSPAFAKSFINEKALCCLICLIHLMDMFTHPMISLHSIYFNSLLQFN